MRIVRDIVKGTLRLSRAEYVKNVLSRFNTDKAKPVDTLLGSHFRLSRNQSPESIISSLCLSYWFTYVLYDLHNIRYFTCSRSCEQIHEQPRKATLGDNEVVKNFSWSPSMKTRAVTYRGGGYYVRGK